MNSWNLRKDRSGACKLQLGFLFRERVLHPRIQNPGSFWPSLLLSTLRVRESALLFSTCGARQGSWILYMLGTADRCQEFEPLSSKLKFIRPWLLFTWFARLSQTSSRSSISRSIYLYTFLYATMVWSLHSYSLGESLAFSFEFIGIPSLPSSLTNSFSSDLDPRINNLNLTLSKTQIPHCSKHSLFN